MFQSRQGSRTMIKIAVLLSVLFSAQAQAQIETKLFAGLKGYAAATTGGQAGSIYRVTSRLDDGTPGTLRYGVQEVSKQGPVWIVFDPVAFPPDTKTAIYLTRQLDIVDKQDITIDGRGSYVSLRRRYHWSDVDWQIVG